ncbi:NBS-LRR type resistance protein [Cucumis melo var. makuwa]|uniref:NBS-LRR type resistance protein n=1 Tax=Cucumis melo var. makuwa TaxID=1194695 RepID=A0A5D3CC38_CUCMM|nr:NBS-LRR type resistance protein [Cucumis melo var. makuwa]
MRSLARLGVFLRDHSHDLGVYLRITCTVRGQLYCVYGVTRTTRGVPTRPLARLRVYLRITYMFMECVPAITRTTRSVPTGSLARFRGVRKVSLTQAKVKNLRSWRATARDPWHVIWEHKRIHQSRDPEGCTYQSSDPEGYTYQSSDPEGCTYQSSDPEGCTYQSSDPEGCPYESSDPVGCT